MEGLMAQKVEKKVFAIGLGYYDKSVVQYDKVFIHTEENNDAVLDFLDIIDKFFAYPKGNVILQIKEITKFIQHLEGVFIHKNHSGAAKFIHMIQENELQDDAFICIMETNAPPTNKEESFLILQLFSDDTLNSLNEEHRTPLTKVFAGLDTIPLSFGGLVLKDNEQISSYDKFPSWLMFNRPGRNRFAPGSFVRQGAHIGERNTLMMGVSVNFGAFVGNDNLLDGHCSIASCVQIANENKIGSFVSMEGVLSPVNEKPVIVGSNNFFGTRCRVGTGMVIGDGNFWGSNVDISKGTPLRDFRKGSGKYYGKYVKAGNKEGIQGANNTMIILNRSCRTFGNIDLYPGEFILTDNTPENQARFERNDDLNKNN